MNSRTPKEALHKKISMAQRFFHRQSRHVNGASETLTLWRQYMKSEFFFHCFCQQQSHEVAKQFGVIARYSYILAYVQTDFQQEDFNGTGTLSKADRACKYGDRTSHDDSDNKKAFVFFFHVLRGRIPMQLPSHVVPFLGNRTYLRTSREALGKRISETQARFQRQSGHANGAKVTVILLRYHRER